MLSVRLYGAASIEELKTRLADRSASPAHTKPGGNGLLARLVGDSARLWPDKAISHRWELERRRLSPQNHSYC